MRTANFGKPTISCPRPRPISRCRSSTAASNDVSIYQRSPSRGQGGANLHTAADWPVSTYYENVAKRLDADRLSVRSRFNITLKAEIRRVFEQNFLVYGVRKVWQKLPREKFPAARL